MVLGIPQEVQFSGFLRAVMVPGGGSCKEQIFKALTWVLPNGQSWLRRKGALMGAYVHTLRQRNIPYGHMVRFSIYNNRQLLHPHSPTFRYEWRPQGPISRTRYRYLKFGLFRGKGNKFKYAVKKSTHSPHIIHALMLGVLNHLKNIPQEHPNPSIDR